MRQIDHHPVRAFAPIIAVSVALSCARTGRRHAVSRSADVRFGRQAIARGQHVGLSSHRRWAVG